MNRITITPNNDYAFKAIFANEANTQLLKSLVNSILNENIKELTVSNGEITKSYLNEKGSRLDILAKTSDGRQINIEMQVNRLKSMPERSVYYGAKLLDRQLYSGEQYGQLRKVICINILDFNLDNCKNPHSIFTFKDNEGLELTDILELHFLQLNLFHVDSPENASLIDCWMEFVKFNDEKKVIELAKYHIDISKALEELKKLENDPKRRAEYEAREAFIKDAVSLREEGREEGREELLRELVLEQLKEGTPDNVICKFFKIDQTTLDLIKKHI